jgi:hypothetical protein
MSRVIKRIKQRLFGSVSTVPKDPVALQEMMIDTSPTPALGCGNKNKKPHEPTVQDMEGVTIRHRSPTNCRQRTATSGVTNSPTEVDQEYAK